jgi:predicted nucleic acid-binding protein
VTAFVDANVVVYANTATADPELRHACLDVLEAVQTQTLRGRTSVAVLEEIWHLELRGRPQGLGGVTADAYVLFTPLLPVTDAIVRDALDVDAPRLGANDRIHLATCRANEIDVILSVDTEFDGIDDMRRVDPRDRKAVGELQADRS